MLFGQKKEEGKSDSLFSGGGFNLNLGGNKPKPAEGSSLFNLSGSGSGTGLFAPSPADKAGKSEATNNKPLWGKSPASEQGSLFGAGKLSLASKPEEKKQGGLSIFGANTAGSGMFGAAPPKLPEETKARLKDPFAASAGRPGQTAPREEVKKLAPSLGATKAFQSQNAAPDKIPTLPADQLSPKSLERTFNRWRTELVNLSNDMRSSESDVQRYESQLLDMLAQIKQQTQVADAVAKVSEQQKNALLEIRHSQVSADDVKAS